MSEEQKRGSEITRTSSQKEAIAKRSIEMSVKREMEHNQRHGINRSEESIRQEYAGIATRVEQEKSAGIYKR